MSGFMRGDWVATHKGAEAYRVERVEGSTVFFEDERGVENALAEEFLIRTEDPFPKLTKLANSKPVWAAEPNPTFNELMAKALKEFPDAYVEEMYGEIVIRTGFKSVRDLNTPLEKLPEE